VDEEAMTDRRRKILVLIKGLNLGGAERLLVDALPYLDRARFEYHFAYLLPWSDQLVPQFEGQGFPVYCLGIVSNSRFPMAVPALHRLQREHRFELFHAHLPMTGLLARLVGRWHRVPIVYTEHNLLERFHPLMLAATRLTYGWNDHVFAVSRGVRDSIVRMGLESKTVVTTLLNGVPVEEVRAEAQNLDELRQELGIPAEHLVVGTVAVFTEQKRLEDWLEVARQIAGQREDVTFLLVGYGPKESVLRARVQAIGLSERIKMPGFRADGRRALGLVDVYLMSSEYEGLPIALLEAMALAKPIVATSVGGIPEVVEDGKQGFLAPVQEVDVLAAHTARLLDNPELRVKMGCNGASKIEQGFHLKTRVRSVENQYLEKLGGGTVAVAPSA
jgi:glycosyltransferase involved in cell wall biosynthesis